MTEFFPASDFLGEERAVLEELHALVFGQLYDFCESPTSGLFTPSQIRSSWESPLAASTLCALTSISGKFSLRCDLLSLLNEKIFLDKNLAIKTAVLRQLTKISTDCPELLVFTSPEFSAHASLSKLFDVAGIYSKHIAPNDYSSELFSIIKDLEPPGILISREAYSVAKSSSPEADEFFLEHLRSGRAFFPAPYLSEFAESIDCAEIKVATQAFLAAIEYPAETDVEYIFTDQLIGVSLCRLAT